MKKDKICLFEDDPFFINFLIESLGEYYQLESFDIYSKSQTPINFIKEHKPALILLDIIMPTFDGMEIAHMIREDKTLSHLPIIFVTAKESIGDKISGFNLGAHDYITKPINPTELKLRVNSCVELYNRFNSAKKELTIESGPFKVDYARNEVSILHSKALYKSIELTATEFKILTYFIKNEGQIIDRSIMLKHLFSGQVSITERSIDVHINSLRKKHPYLKTYLKTVYGQGYIFQFSKINSPPTPSL